MSMIVLDMEWNQPVNPDSPQAVRLCTELPFEIIQIGAVRLEDGARFKATCCLQQYKVLSPRISRLTGISRQDVRKGERFPDAMDRFRAFCGEDPVLLTWGFNDIPILRQNLRFYGLNTGFTEKNYNLQIMFHQQHDPESPMRGLSFAVEFFQLQVEDSYHDGLNDAAYTAAVARYLDIPKGMEEYPDYLKHFEGDGDPAFLDCLRYANYTRFESFEDMIADRRIKACPCPRCGGATEATDPIYPETGRMVYSCRCPEHGEYLVRVGFKRNRDDSLRANKAVYPMDETHLAQYRKAVEKAAKPRKEKKAPFTLYIDADGCPVINQALGAASRRRVPSFLICDTRGQGRGQRGFCHCEAAESGRPGHHPGLRPGGPLPEPGRKGDRPERHAVHAGEHRRPAGESGRGGQGPAERRQAQGPCPAHRPAERGVYDRVPGDGPGGLRGGQSGETGGREEGWLTSTSPTTCPSTMTIPSWAPTGASGSS